MLGSISRFILKSLGWKIVGNFPDPNCPKNILAVVPHTSNWDFFLGILVRSAINSNTKFLAKHSLFRAPYGWIFRALGGYPVDRTKNNNLVESVKAIFDSKDEFSITIAPEGTRKKVSRLRTGFYHIARAANIPIILCRFDWGNKVVSFSEPFFPTGDQDADMEFIKNHFKGVIGKNPELSFGV